MTTGFSMTIATIYAQTSDTGSQQAPGWTMLIYGALFLAIFYFMIIRPQSQAKKQQEALISAAKVGDKIVTTGGILGVIANVKDKTVMVKVSENTKIEVLKAHISSIIKSENSTES
jgi:preprotein translocase subunit YajC